VFVADNSGTAAYTVTGSGTATRLHLLWSKTPAGTSPFVAGGLLYVYDPGGSLRVYGPATGHPLANLPTGTGHWNSPIVAGKMVIVPVGDANVHLTTGQVDVFRLP
jgi:hypothetical protein